MAMLKYSVSLVLLAILLALGVLLYRHSRDEALDPAVVSWLAQPPPAAADADNGFIFLMGIDARKGQDPLTVGRERIDRIDKRNRSGRELSFFDVDQSGPQFPDHHLVPEHWLLCNRGDLRCIDLVASPDASLADLLATTELWQQRYQAFLQFPAYVTVDQGLAIDALVPYATLAQLNRLAHLVAVRELRAGNPRAFVSYMLQDLQGLRSMMAKADDFLLKQSMALGIVEDLQLLIRFYIDYPALSGTIDATRGVFEPLSVAERSLDRAMRGQFHQHARKVATFRQEPYLVAEPYNPLVWFRGLTFKMNRTLNEIHPYFQRNVDVSVAEPADYLTRMRANEPLRSIWNQDNIVGSMVNRKSVIDYRGYLGVFSDISCFIKLAGLRLMMPSSISDVASGLAGLNVDNPYDGSPPHVTADGHSLCYRVRAQAELCVPLIVRKGAR